jgi:hypothetical protein
MKYRLMCKLVTISNELTRLPSCVSVLGGFCFHVKFHQHILEPAYFDRQTNVSSANINCIVFIVYSVSFIICVLLSAVFLFECGVLFCMMCYLCVVSYCSNTATV